MKKIIIAFALCLSACATVPSSPVAVANTTLADEKIATPAELIYKTWRMAVEIAVKSGKLAPGSEKAHKIAAIDNQLYAAVQIVRSTYNTINSPDYLTAVSRINTLLNTGYAILKG